MENKKSKLKNKIFCLNLFIFFRGLGYILGSSVTLWTNQWQWSLRITPFIGLGLLIFIFLYFDDPVRGQIEGAHLRRSTYWEDIKALSQM